MIERARTPFDELTSNAFEQTVRAVSREDRRGGEFAVSVATRKAYAEVLKRRMGGDEQYAHYLDNVVATLTYGPFPVRVDESVEDNVVVFLSEPSGV